MLRLVNRFNLTHNFRSDLLSGLTVAIALVPEAVAFAFVAGVKPLVGLYAAVIVGLITAIFGGRPGMISGATGAMAVVMTALVAEYGVEYLFAAVVLAGFIQLSVGVLRLGKFIRLVPHPVMLGFVNGLAIVIFLAQFSQFKIDGAWMQGLPLWEMLSLVILTMMIIFGLPKFMPRLSAVVPSALVAIILTSLIVIFAGLNTPTVGDIASVYGGLPSFHLPDVPFSMDTLSIIFPFAIILSGIGLIESLLTLNLVDEMTETRGRTSRECVGQGLANMTCGVFGAMGGCAMIGQTMININSGGRGRLSGIAAALFLLSFILIGSSLIDRIPIAALVGLMFVVVIKTFAWTSLRLAGKIPVEDLLVILIVTVITVLTDLAMAVVIGVIISALVYAWKSAHHLWVEQSTDNEGTKHYRLQGPLFFGSVQSFRDLFDPRDDPDDVVIDFAASRVWDHSAIEAIDSLATRYKNNGKRLHLVHLSQDCKFLMKRAGNLVEVNSMEDPEYMVFVDYSKAIES